MDDDDFGIINVGFPGCGAVNGAEIVLVVPNDSICGRVRTGDFGGV